MAEFLIITLVVLLLLISWVAIEQSHEIYNLEVIIRDLTHKKGKKDGTK